MIATKKETFIGNPIDKSRDFLGARPQTPWVRFAEFGDENKVI
jgi:hypothetical protein